MEEAQRLARQVEQPALIAEAVSGLAELEHVMEQREAACTGLREGLTIYERPGNPSSAAVTRQRLQDLGCKP